MIIETLRLRNFRCFGDATQEISFEPGLTAFVGNNGAGKTTVIAALQKLFGARVEDRRLVREDVHFGKGEEPGLAIDGDPAGPNSLARVAERNVEIEVIIRLDELSTPPTGTDSVPEVFRAMCVQSPGELPRLRIRLEATWKVGVEEDDIHTRLFWVTTLDDVPFGERDIAKRPFKPEHRKRIQVRYLPATRDGNAIIRQALRELLAWLERFGDWTSGRQPMAEQWDQLQALFDDMPAIKTVTDELGEIWTQLFEGPHLKSPKLTVLQREIQRALKELSMTLGPGPAGRHRSVHDLSEGQSSLFYIAMIITLIKLDDRLSQEKIEGFQEYSALRPWLTIIALEEPENHLSPFYLSRMVQLMTEIAGRGNVMSVLTTHSPSSLRRLRPKQVRHIRHDPLTLLSQVNVIPMPPLTDPEAHKFVQEAVTAHPELYFARLAILGEGRSEQIVLPQVARALHQALELDPAFVAFVPLGGRHVNHFWRLLAGLDIPHVTLLDYDLGRVGAGPLRLKYAVEQLAKRGVAPPDGTTIPADAADWRALSLEDRKGWRAWLENQGVYFSLYLDLDMMMLQAFPEAYEKVSGVSAPAEGANYKKAVFGEAGEGLASYPADAAPSLLELAQYEQLFKKGSKPVAHVEALTEIAPNQLAAACPKPLKALFARCASLLGIDIIEAPGADVITQILDAGLAGSDSGQ